MLKMFSIQLIFILLKTSCMIFIKNKYDVVFCCIGEPKTRSYPVGNCTYCNCFWFCINYEKKKNKQHQVIDQSVMI